MNGWTDGNLYGNAAYDDYVIETIDEVSTSSDLVLFADASRRSVWPLDTEPAVEPVQVVSNPSQHLQRYAVDRHAERINAAMFDGSGKAVSIRDLKDEVKFYDQWGQ